MTRVFMYMGAAIVLSAELLMLVLVMPSNVPRLVKGGVLILCLASAAFVVFGMGAYQTQHTTSGQNYRRVATICWWIGAAAIAMLAAAAFMGLL